MAESRSGVAPRLRPPAPRRWRERRRSSRPRNAASRWRRRRAPSSRALFAHLLPAFKQATGIDVRVVAARHRAGARHGRDAATPTSCSCTTRRPRRSSSPKASGSSATDVMYNDFVIVGPKADPGRREGKRRRCCARQRSPRSRAPFNLARDKSGTHARRAALLEDGRHRRRRRRSSPATSDAAAAWGLALNIGPSVRRLRADRPRHLAQLQESRQPGDPGRGRHSASSTSTASSSSTRRSIRTSRCSLRRRSPTGRCSRRRGSGRSPRTSVGGEQLFLPRTRRPLR